MIDRDRVVSTVRLPAAGDGMAIEVELVEPDPPGRWRVRLALMLIRLAGKIARIRVRVAPPSGPR